jgi:hypothetical protein
MQPLNNRKRLMIFRETTQESMARIEADRARIRYRRELLRQSRQRLDDGSANALAGGGAVWSANDCAEFDLVRASPVGTWRVALDQDEIDQPLMTIWEMARWCAAFLLTGLALGAATIAVIDYLIHH